MSKKETVKIMVEGGNATPGPPLGPALGPLGVNAGKVVEAINKATSSFFGMRIPVEVIVDPATKQFEIKVGTPPTSALLIKATGLEKGGGGKDLVGDISIDQVIEVAKSKLDGLLAHDMTAAVVEVVGTCQTLRLSINGLTPKEMTAAIKTGALDDYLLGKTKTLPKLVHKEEKSVKLLGHIEAKKKEDAAPTAEGAAPAEGEKKAEGDKKPEGDKKSEGDKKPAAGGDKKEKKK
jgi:large subunit ribosomal protein L11